MTLHLNDDQIDSLLIGDATAEAAAHVAGCAACAARLEALAVPLASFNEVSLAWGERRSATLPQQLVGRHVGWFGGTHRRLAIGAAAVAFFILSSSLSRLYSGPAPAKPSGTQVATSQQTSPQAGASAAAGTASAAGPGASQSDQAQSHVDQVAQDNRLLAAIDRELAASEAPADLLRLNAQHEPTPSAEGTHNE